jgi:hypothetical protein
MTAVTSSIVAFFQTVSGTVAANQAVRRSEAERTAQIVKDQLARNKTEEDAKRLLGAEPETGNEDWQTTRRAIFDTFQCQVLDTMHPNDVMPFSDIVELFVILRQLQAMGCWARQDDMNKSGGCDSWSAFPVPAACLGPQGH